MFIALVRLIPAYAGRTMPRAVLVINHWAHPRLRGADRRRSRIRAARGGSSPLTRGGRTSLALLPLIVRLIPAYAGRTVHDRARGGHPRAHPRLRGADNSVLYRFSPCWGSSPLTRGGLEWREDLFAALGLIPAYAGRTGQRRVWIADSGAHPRLRGADSAKCDGLTRIRGSSPLTRGGLASVSLRSGPLRLIPAYAGRTTPSGAAPANHWAHPRLRGADRQLGHASAAMTGSSPLTRGGPGVWCEFVAHLRLIPAYAGRTIPIGVRCGAKWAHPRLRGADKAQASAPV